MSAVKRALVFQLLGLALVAAALVVAARHFPILEYVTHAQQKIGAMEFWGGVVYPLFYALCNVLLLPGGVVAIGSGLFFGLWWGFSSIWPATWWGRRSPFGWGGNWGAAG